MISLILDPLESIIYHYVEKNIIFHIMYDILLKLP